MNRVLLVFALFSSSAVAHAENWPQWRGPDRDGESKETGLPAEWGANKNVAWKLPMPGPGSSTPVVWENRIFLTCADSNNDLLLLCISTDGKELWRRGLGNVRIRTPGGEGNGASPSPATDGKHVYAFAGSGDLACFDFDGNEIWKFNAQSRYGKFNIQFGIHITPVLYGDRLYLALLYTGGQWVIAVDKATGKDVWKIDRQSDGQSESLHSYASPTLWSNGSDAYLLVHGNDYTTAHRLEDGKELWRLGDLNPKNKYNHAFRFVASPVATPELIVVPTAKNGPVVGVKPNATGVIKAGSEGEQWRRPRDTPDVPSPLVHDGLVYLCRENGVVICMEAKTGKELYSQRIHSARYRASPVYADGKIYLSARDGTVTVLKAGQTFEKISENKLPDQIAASPAISGGRIYLRGFETLYAISNPEKKQQN